MEVRVQTESIYLRLIAVASLLVPRRFRSEWRREWEAEIVSRWRLLKQWGKWNTHNKLDLLKRIQGAFWDALWFQKRRADEAVLLDLRLSANLLKQHPRFTAKAILILTLGISISSILMGLANSVLLKPLPYRDSAELTTISGNLHRPGLEKLESSASEYIDYRRETNLFSELGAYQVQGFNLSGNERPERITGARVTASLFHLFEVPPLHGQVFANEADTPDDARVVILSYELWQQRFHGDTNAVGGELVLDGQRVKVIGVMPQEFRFPEKNVSLWIPVVFTPKLLSEDNRGSRFLNVLARLRPEVTVDHARSEMTAFSEKIRQENPKDYLSGFNVNILPLYFDRVGDRQPLLLILLVTAVLLLFFSCTNVINLLSIRIPRLSLPEKERDTPVRHSRIVGGQGLLLGLVSATISLLFVGGVFAMLPRLSLDFLPRIDDVQLDKGVVFCALAISLLTCIVCSVVPSLSSNKARSVSSWLPRNPISKRLFSRNFRSFLAVTQIGLAVVLLVATGVGFRSLMRLHDVNPGFDPDDVHSMRIALSSANYSNFSKQQDFFQQLFARLRSNPNIESTGAVDLLPLSGSGADRSLLVEGRQQKGGQSYPDEQIRLISPQYFSTMSIPVRLGRDFADQDNSDSLPVAIINKAMARKFWPTETAIGKRVAFRGIPTAPVWITIIGVVADVKHDGLDSETKPEVYLPYTQPLFAESTMPPMFLVVRSRLDQNKVAAAVLNDVQALDSNQPVSDIRPMSQRLEESLARRRFGLLVLTIFASLASVLVLTGLEGNASVWTAQFGRQRLDSASSGDLRQRAIRNVLWKGLKLAVIGIGIGLGMTYGLRGLVSEMSFQVSATDPLILVFVSILLGAMAMLSCYLTVRRTISEQSGFSWR